MEAAAAVLSPRAARWTLIATILGASIAFIDGTVVNVALPAIERVLGASTADARSVLAVMGLGATSGQQITVRAAGPDAREAVTAMIGILAAATPVGG